MCYNGRKQTEKELMEELKRKLYMVLDTETATVPEYTLLPEERQKGFAIMHPIIYDIGWLLMERNGNIVKQKSYLVSETFGNVRLFQTAYYKDKRNQYLADWKQGLIKLETWDNIMKELREDMEASEYFCAYNASFDMRAIRYTEKYVAAVYGDMEAYDRWIEWQLLTEEEKLARGWVKKEHPEETTFSIRGGKPLILIDIWTVACDFLKNSEKYKNYCLSLSAYNLYFKTNAEIVYRFFMQNDQFEEAHTALEDAKIESWLLTHFIERKKAIKKGVVRNPFTMLGTIKQYECQHHVS